MSGQQTPAAELRLAFDRSFAEKPREPAKDERSFVRIRLAGDTYTVLIDEIDGIFVDRKIIALAGRLPELLGVTGLRGNVVPVFALDRLLGYPPAGSTPRWLLVARELPVGFAFDEFDGQISVPASRIATASGELSRTYTRQTVTVGNGTNAVIGIPLLVRSIGERSGAITDSSKEH